MENVVPIADLNNFIEEAVLKVRLGLAQARIAGTLVEMPEVIQFSVLLVKEWQPESLAYESADNGTNSGSQGGTSTTVANGTSLDTGIEVGNDGDTGTSTQTSTDNGTSSDTTTSNDIDTGTTTDNGTSGSSTSYNGEGSSTTNVT